MTWIPDPLKLPDDLPIPQDDGACNHLLGANIPRVELIGTDGAQHRLDLIAAQYLVLYLYPATGRPGYDPGPSWDTIPGAPGCTVQSVGFRDSYSDFVALNFAVIGMSAQTTEEQREFTIRHQIPYLLLSDPEFKCAGALNLPTFIAGGRAFYKQLVIVVVRGIIEWVFYPVFPPQESAAAVLKWLKCSNLSGKEASI